MTVGQQSVVKEKFCTNVKTKPQRLACLRSSLSLIQHDSLRVQLDDEANLTLYDALESILSYQLHGIYLGGVGTIVGYQEKAWCIRIARVATQYIEPLQHEQ